MKSIRCELCGADCQSLKTKHVCLECHTKWRKAIEYRQHAMEWKDRMGNLMDKHNKLMNRLDARRKLCASARKQRDGLCWAHGLPINRCWDA